MRHLVTAQTVQPYSSYQTTRVHTWWWQPSFCSSLAGKQPKDLEANCSQVDAQSDSGDDNDKAVAITVPILVVVFIALVVCAVILAILVYRAWARR